MTLEFDPLDYANLTRHVVSVEVEAPVTPYVLASIARAVAGGDPDLSWLEDDDPGEPVAPTPAQDAARGQGVGFAARGGIQVGSKNVPVGEMVTVYKDPSGRLVVE